MASSSSDTSEGKNKRHRFKKKITWKQDINDEEYDSEDEEIMNRKYNFGKCDKHNHQIDMNDLIIRVLNPGHFIHAEKMNFKFTNYTQQVYEENEKFLLS